MEHHARVRASLHGLTADSVQVQQTNGLAYIEVGVGVSYIHPGGDNQAEHELELLKIAGKIAAGVAEPDAAVSMLCASIREALARDELVEVGQLVDAIEALTAHRATHVPDRLRQVEDERIAEYQAAGEALFKLGSSGF